MKISFPFKVCYKLKVVFFRFGGAGNFIRFENIELQRLLGPPTTSPTVAVHTYMNDGNAPNGGGGGSLHTLCWWYFAHFGRRVSHGDDILTPQSRRKRTYLTESSNYRWKNKKNQTKWQYSSE